MVRLQGIHVISSLVHRYELLRALADVFLLRCPSDGLLPAQVDYDADHLATDHPDGDRLLRQLLGVHVPQVQPIVSYLVAQYSTIDVHVFQLLRVVRQILLQIVSQLEWQEETGKHSGQHLHQQ